MSDQMEKVVLDLREIWSNAPDWASGIVVVWVGKTGYLAGPIGALYSFPRPASSWQPKEGETVFALDGTKTKVIVARVLRIEGDFAYITYFGKAHGTRHSVSFRGEEIFCKPFDPAKIGLPWEQI